MLIAVGPFTLVAGFGLKVHLHGPVRAKPTQMKKSSPTPVHEKSVVNVK